MPIPVEAPWEIEVFYDGACPLCKREIAWLRRLDARGKIRFTDIAEPAFDPTEVGVEHDTLMAAIHGRLPDGRIVTGVEVFRRLYSAVGFRWLVAPTRWPLISPLLDWAYHRFAERRLRWTGRCKPDGECRVR